ncbi:MAG: aspartyl protease family protein [Spirochaetales bacterium]|nr:aspartyl protease family protein [Spirochaetales bacterium]
MKKRFLIIVTLAAFLLQSCVSTTKLTITTIDERALIEAQKTVEYETFWEAMENIDFSYLREHQINDDQQSFAEALKLAVDGDIEDAENEFRKLYISSDDSLIKKHSKEILGNLLLFQSKWEALIKLSIDVDDTTNNNIRLEEAFSKSPRESYYFPTQPAIIPMQLSLSGCPVIEVEINGHKKKFWIDTGAGLSVVASDIAEECNIFPIGTENIKAGTGTNKKVDAQPAIIEDFRIGEILIKNHPIIIIDNKDLEFKLFGLFRIMKIDGIIGWNVIQNIDIEIDYRKKVTSIKKPIKIDSPNRNFFWLGYPIVTLINQEGTKLNFGLDTGARKTSLTDNILKKINVNNIHIKNITLGSAGGLEKIESKIIPELTLILNGYGLHFNDIGTQPGSFPVFVKLDGILGSDVLKNGRVKIDYLNGIFEIKFRKWKIKNAT